MVGGTITNACNPICLRAFCRTSKKTILTLKCYCKEGYHQCPLTSAPLHSAHIVLFLLMAPSCVCHCSMYGCGTTIFSAWRPVCFKVLLADCYFRWLIC